MKRIRLNDFEAQEILGYVNSCGKYRIKTKEEYKRIALLKFEYRHNSEFFKHCKERRIDPNDVSMYWDKTKEFSIRVDPKPTNEVNPEDLFNNFINEYSKKEFKPIKPKSSGRILQIFFTDVHIGMNPDEKGVSLYGGSWGKKDLFERLDVMINEIYQLSLNDYDCIQVINMGDYADGLDGFTVRRGHSLPQNMSNEEVFNVGVEFMMRLHDAIRDVYNKDIIWYNVCNSNHSSSFDYFISESFRGIVTRQYDKINVINERKFIGHFTYGKHTEIITHGKDDVSLKFGFRYNLDSKGKDKISEYIRFNKLDRNDNHLFFHKGDSHVEASDKSELYDFNSYLPFSPSSSWVQVNFKSGRSGFTFVEKDINNYSNIKRTNFEFEWGNNNLK